MISYVEIVVLRHVNVQPPCHARFPVHNHNCTALQNGFLVDLGSAATVSFTTSGVLFHNCTTHYEGFHVDVSSTTTNVSTTLIKQGLTRHASATISQKKVMAVEHLSPVPDQIVKQLLQRKISSTK